MKHVEIICPECHQPALKRAAEVKRQNKKDRKVYCSVECSNKGSATKRVKYPKFTKLCGICSTEFTTSNAVKAPKFCSQTCGATAARRSQGPEEDKKRSQKIKAAWDKGSYDSKAARSDKGSQQIIKLCLTCNSEFQTLRRAAKFCSRQCFFTRRRGASSSLSAYRTQCLFDFNLADYPEEFDFELVRKYGWYSPTNKKDNLSGVSRDHMVSVKYGFDHNIDPEIISHPANCQLLRQEDNFKKKCSCSISLEKLHLKIERWNKKYNLCQCSSEEERSVDN